MSWVELLCCTKCSIHVQNLIEFVLDHSLKMSLCDMNMWFVKRICLFFLYVTLEFIAVTSSWWCKVVALFNFYILFKLNYNFSCWYSRFTFHSQLHAFLYSPLDSVHIKYCYSNGLYLNIIVVDCALILMNQIL